LIALTAAAVTVLGILAAQAWAIAAQRADHDGRLSSFLRFSAPAGDRPATTDTVIDGVRAAVLPNGRLVTPAGREVNVQAPKPFGMALSPDGRTVATLNSGAGPFSLTLVSQLASPIPVVKRLDVNASFMGVTFSPDSTRVYLSGGENGNIWIADAIAGKIVGSVNLNGPTHPLDRPLSVVDTPVQRFKGAFPGNMALGSNGRFLYVVDQAGFQVHVIDTTKVSTGLNPQGRIVEPDNFAAVVGHLAVGRYPFGIGLTPDDRTLLVTNVGVFQYTHLRPASPTGNDNLDYPLCYPGAGYPQETRNDRVISITKVDPRNLPDSLRDADGIRCGYVPADRLYTVPGLGSPNAPESSSVFVADLSRPDAPQRREIVKTGPLVGDRDEGVDVYSGSHPNSVAIGPDAIYVANGNNDSVSVLDPRTFAERGRIGLSLLRGQDRALRGVQPVGLALSPDGRFLYVAEAGVNAIGVIRVEGKQGRLVGHIPTGWWPSSVQVSADGRTLYVANARGRGAGPNLVGESRSPKFSVLGTVNIIATPGESQLEAFTARVYKNNGFADSDGDALRGKDDRDDGNPIPSRAGRPSRQIKHVVFINKENATHDLMLGDITQTPPRRAGERRAGVFTWCRRESQSPRAGAAVRLQRQLLSRALRVIGRTPLAHRPVHDGERRDPLAGVIRRTAS
jgi:DNA-binding beta-propeller fold protein YncE